MREHLNNYLSTQPPGVRNSNGIGYVIIKAKNNASREKYIKDCTLKGCITIVLENGGFVENVPVLKHVWNYIEFPEEENKIGSCVSWSNVDQRNLIIINGVLPKIDEINNINENQFLISKKFTKKIKGKQIQNYLEISGDAKAGKINISIDGGDEDGELLINVFNNKKTANVNLNVKGKFLINTSKGLFYQDEYENKVEFTQDNIQLLAKKLIKLGKGKEGITLGDQAKNMFNSFIDEVAKITVTTALGTMPILNAAQILLLKKNTSSIISKYSFTD